MLFIKNVIEDFDSGRLNDPFRWIPQGIYYDLFDNRNESSPVIDNVQGYTNLQFFNALDNDVTSLQAYRVRYLAENGFNQAVVDLFAEYNY